MWSEQLATIRRVVTVAALKGVLAAARSLREPTIRRVAHWLAAAARESPLATHLRANIDRALGRGTSSPETVRRYFRRFANTGTEALLVHRHGLIESGVHERTFFGSSVRHLDDAVARGRGVVIICPHLFGYEIAAGLVNTRHKLIGLARAGNSDKAVIKRTWYKALGLETVTRPRGRLSLLSAWDCLSVLREGHCLGITPDLVDNRDGVPVNFLGRSVRLTPGAFAVAILGRAPVVTAYGVWGDSDYPVLEFSEPKEYTRVRGEDLRDRLHEPMQDWCREFESYLRRWPENWMFWLDKRWSQLIRQ